jgi:hypothetical protein
MAGDKYQVGIGLAGTTVTMRLDGHLMHAIADGALAGTWPCPITAERAARLAGARAAATPLPRPAARRIDRRPPRGTRQRPDHGQPAHQARPRHVGKLFTIIIEDTHQAPCDT